MTLDRAVRNSQPLRSSTDTGSVDVGAQRLGEARDGTAYTVLFAAFLMQPTFVFCRKTLATCDERAVLPPA
jgi:hypothetical protein